MTIAEYFEAKEEAEAILSGTSFLDEMIR